MDSSINATEHINRYDSLRVLVADDNAINQRLLSAVLQSWRINPHVVDDGAAALSKAKRFRFDLMLLDIAMPGMDGLTLVRRIRELERFERRSGSLIYMVSSQYEPQDVLASKAAGANGHLAKPIAIQRLLDCVEESLRSAQPPEQLARTAGA